MVVVPWQGCIGRSKRLAISSLLTDMTYDKNQAQLTTAGPSILLHQYSHQGNMCCLGTALAQIRDRSASHRQVGQQTA
jgi:hypothetical protein